MRRLTLLRHAEACALDFDRIQTDPERPLSEAGQADARALAARLAAAPHPPSHILTSSAQRAQETAHAVATALALEASRYIVDAFIYGASATRLLQLVAKQPEDVEHLLLCGHNPGVSMLARDLARHPASTPILAPCMAIELALDIACWADIAVGTVRVEDSGSV